MRLFTAIIIALASLLYVAPAMAQATISIANETSLPRIDKNGNDIKKRDQTLNPEAVSLQDCVDDQRIRFTLLMAGFEGNASIEVWAAAGGVDCSAQTTRTSASQQCWKVSSNVPLSQTVNVDIPVRNIMSGAPPNTPVAPSTDPNNLCGKVDLTKISVQFLYFSPGNIATPASKKDVAITVDTVGPAPPTGIRVLPGNTRIQVTWDNISGEGGLSVLSGVRVYCDPAQATTITTTKDASCTITQNEASTDPDAEAGTEDAGTTEVCEEGGVSTTTTADCSSANFLQTTSDGKVEPKTPDGAFNSTYLCGEAPGNTGTTVVATKIGDKPLVNGTRYAVAVAATDAYGNVGPLSDVICETPELTTDFWENYRDAGGQAGGGFCATAPEETPLGSFASFGVVIVAAAGVVRRMRKGRR